MSYDFIQTRRAINDAERQGARLGAKPLLALIQAMQADAEKYLMPDNECGRDWFISRILWHLDGPEQRAAMERAQKAMGKLLKKGKSHENDSQD